MIQSESKVKVADNTGARQLECIRVLGASGRRYGRVGDIFVASVKAALPQATVKKNEVVRAVLVRSNQPIKRSDGTTVRFDENAAVIIDANGNPRGSRIFGPIAREVRDSASQKIVSMAPEVL